MALSQSAAREVATDLLHIRGEEKQRLGDIHSYMYVDRDNNNTSDNRRRPSWLLASVPDEIKRLAEFSRVDMLPYIVRAAYQSLYVEGFREPRADRNEQAWRAWQRNQMDRRQIGVHKAALAYGKAYLTIVPNRNPGDSMPALRGVSPRKLTTAWGDDDLWPMFSLEKLGTGKLWRMLDETHAYFFEGSQESLDKLEFVSSQEHGITSDGEPVCPVVLYRETDDLDEPVIGLVEPLMDLQDQINFTTFSLMVAQHFGAFKQRAIAGWVPENEAQKLKASAERLWTFMSENMKFFEFKETDLEGYLKSREATYRNLATIAQQSPFELLGTLTNLSAEALALADASRQRASTEYAKALGESHEQSLTTAGEQMGAQTNPDAEARWGDTAVQTLSQFVDALGKAATLLEIPPRALWDRFADRVGASQSEVDRWERIRREEGSQRAIEQIVGRLGRQRGAPTGTRTGANQS